MFEFKKQEFGERVKEIRTASNLQQEEFGQILNLTKQAISKIENGHRAVSIEILFLICKHFNISADYLLGLKDKDDKSKTAN